MTRVLFALFAALLFIQSCSNDFELTAPWKEVPIVYAILSPTDTAHYVRVEKAFLDPETSALQIAQIPDSIYYPASAIQVFIEEVATGKKFPLKRVDGRLEGYPRKDGIFATSPNWLYKTKETLVPGRRYRLRIVRNDGRPDVTAETTLPGNFTIQSPDPSLIPVRITFLRDRSSNITWFSDSNGVYFAIRFRIRIRENNLNGTLVKRDTLYWTPVPNTRRSNVLTSNGFLTTERILSESFYRFLVEKLPPATTTFRRFEGIDITIEGGGREIERYLETAAANAGITGAELVSLYTNLSEGFGIFTGKNVVVLPNVSVTPETVNSMNERSPERDLNFQ
ncbi:MAG: DUF4249 family protein [Saprospiraceae bacterium]|nr:DUF4249 domain-containing protein [Saprospiraceae bacterium]MDW8230612.1 DUF4249 family protein [Saprospiraceae bacterium]